MKKIAKDCDFDAQEALVENFREIFKLWDKQDTSMVDRVKFLDDMERDFTNIASVKKRLMLELEYLCVIKLSDQEYKMIELLNQRASFRGQIDYESEQFSYKYNRKQYQAIQSIDSEI